MSRKCETCCHEKRLEIDRALLRGVSCPQIAREYDLSPASVENHRKNHLSRQLVNSENARVLMNAETLAREVQELIDKTKEILRQAESKKHWNISLKALAELRQIFSFMVSTLFLLKENERREKKSTWKATSDELARLSMEELEQLDKLMMKMKGEDVTILPVRKMEEKKVVVVEKEKVEEKRDSEGLTRRQRMETRSVREVAGPIKRKIRKPL